MEAGTYTLLLELASETTIEFGAAGPRELRAGSYAYTGSAFGPGGLSRIARHRRVADGENTTRHWHVDYLLGAAKTRWVGHWAIVDRKLECTIADSLVGSQIEGIGATDCDCSSHLRFGPDRQPLVESIESAYAQARTASLQ